MLGRRTLQEVDTKLAAHKLYEVEQRRRNVIETLLKRCRLKRTTSKLRHVNDETDWMAPSTNRNIAGLLVA